MKATNYSSIGFLGMALFWLIGCTGVSVNAIDDPSPEMNKRVVFFVAKSIEFFPPGVTRSVAAETERRLAPENFSSFAFFLNRQASDSQFQESLLLKRQRDTYVGTFVLTGVSDKDLSSRIGKAMEVDQFFILHLDQFPCTECSGGKVLWVKYDLVDAKSGERLWSGRLNIELDDDEIEPEVFAELTQENAEAVLDAFTSQFVVPWHRLRYQNLQKLAQQ